MSNQEIVSIVNLLAKLSESLTILDKNYAREHEFSLKVWMCQMIVQFAVASIGTLLVLMACGF